MKKNTVQLGFFLLIVLLVTAALPQNLNAQNLTRRERTRLLAQSLAKSPGIPSETSIRSMGADTDYLLTNIVQDKTLSLETRLKAVDCLGYFSNKRSRQVLYSMLGDPTWDKPFQHRAMVSLARAFGEQEFQFLKNFAQESDRETRLAAIRALGIMRTPRVASFLQGLIPSENDTIVIQAIMDALR